MSVAAADAVYRGTVVAVCRGMFADLPVLTSTRSAHDLWIIVDVDHVARDDWWSFRLYALGGLVAATFAYALRKC